MTKLPFFLEAGQPHRVVKNKSDREMVYWISGDYDILLFTDYHARLRWRCKFKDWGITPFETMDFYANVKRWLNGAPYGL